MTPRRFALLVCSLTAIFAGGISVYALAAADPQVRRPRSASMQAQGITLPKDFPRPRIPKANPMNATKVAIGRRLFYDRRLSGNATQSCGSCHRPELAFTDGRKQAIGSTGQEHPRSAQSLVNVAYQLTLTWANPALVSLEAQMEVPLFSEHPVEMGVTDANKARVLSRIRSDRWYARRFGRAFPGSKRPTTWATIIRSIAAFQRTIISADSRYDRYLRRKARLTRPSVAA